jgi:hypothetical protein
MGLRIGCYNFSRVYPHIVSRFQDLYAPCVSYSKTLSDYLTVGSCSSSGFLFSNCDSSATIYTTVTTTYDAQSLSTAPADLAPLPTGSYLLPITVPEVYQSSCLDTASHAWSCSLPPNSIVMTISNIIGNPRTSYYSINISSEEVPMSYFYGAQPPVIPSEPVLHLVNDTQSPQEGPAWFFQLPYDKVIVVPEDQLSPPSNLKRDRFELREEEKDFSQKGVAQIGAKPWFCYWNDTILETFIYVNKASMSGASASGASVSVASTSVNSGSAWSSTPWQGNYQMQTATTTSPPSIATSQSGYGYSRSSQYVRSNYPKIVKVEERRIPGISHPPYCVKMEIQGDNSARPWQDNEGNQVQFWLNETEPYLPYASAKRSVPEDVIARDTELVQRQQSPRVCQCVWRSS